ncbi:MAG: hypothetical protein M1608_01830 [Candidatus Omnitrophica bacterium]|nr:hypothetical protein [Candidatus Omnitrophota bacterium]
MMTRVFQSSWMALTVGILAYWITTFILIRPHLLPGSALRPTFAGDTSPFDFGPSWQFKNPELDQMLGELREEREAVQRRTTELNEWENRLKAEHQEVLAVTQTVYRVQQEIDETIVRVKEEEMANLKKLAKVYASMSPDGAAAILKEMQDDQVVKILVYMKEDEVAPIIETLGKTGAANARRAAMISNRIRLSISRVQPKNTKSQ